MASDYYAVLGVEREATEEEIKKAYRRKARELHPDVNTADDAEERFKELNEAYDVLSNPNKKSQYDQFGTVNGNGFGGGGAGGYQYVDLEDLFGGMGGVGDVFSTFFGGRGGRTSTVRTEGRDMSIGLIVTLEEVATGASKEIAYDRLAPCDECDGTGAAEGGQEVTCPDCNGTGHVTTMRRTILGNMQTQTPCEKCQGTGKIIDKPCVECGGQGRVPDREHVTVEVPKGIRDGQRLRVENYGEAGMHGATSGDLFVTIHVQENPAFYRDGDNLHTRVPVSIAQAALGAEIEVEGILGNVKVHIPEGCQQDQKVKAKGEGLPRLNSESRGDLICHIDVIVPRKLSAKSRELLEELAGELGEEVDEHKSSFQKIKDAFMG